MEKEVKKEEMKATYTQEEVKQNFVPIKDYTTLSTEYQKLVKAFNKLLKEYNDLHLRALFVEEE